MYLFWREFVIIIIHFYIRNLLKLLLPTYFHRKLIHKNKTNERRDTSYNWIVQYFCCFTLFSCFFHSEDDAARLILAVFSAFLYLKHVIQHVSLFSMIKCISHRLTLLTYTIHLYKSVACSGGRMLFYKIYVYIYMQDSFVHLF